MQLFNDCSENPTTPSPPPPPPPLQISPQHTYRATGIPAGIERNQDKWISDFQAYASEEIDWSKTYSLPFLCTRESKLRVFQFNLVHRRISRNRYLFKVGLSTSEQCTFCENTSESLLHLFWECPKTKVLWNEVIKWSGNFSCLLTKSFSPQLCLSFGDDTRILFLHHAFLIARYHFFGG